MLNTKYQNMEIYLTKKACAQLYSIVILFIVFCFSSCKKTEIEVPPYPPLSKSATLADMEFSTGKMNLSFDSTITTYLVEVPGDVTSISITPTANSSKATITINGSSVLSGHAFNISNLDIDNGTNVSIVVTAQNDTATTTYTAVIKRYQTDVKHGTTPTLDGIVNSSEWSDAEMLDLFLGSDFIGNAYVKHDGQNLWVGFLINDDTPQLDHFGDRTMVYVDTDFDQSQYPQSDDYFFVVLRGDTSFQSQGLGTNTGNASDWDTYSSMGAWTSLLNDQTSTWSVEYKIPFSDLGIVAGNPKTIGMNFGTSDAFTYWPAWIYEPDFPNGTNWLQPNSWGKISSSDNWQ